MTDFVKQLEDLGYLKALKTVDCIETPAKGFVKPSDHTTTIDLLRAVVKQNNTLISLLISQGEDIRELQNQVKQIKKQQQQPPETASKELESSIDELTKRLGGLNLGGEAIIPKKKGVILVHKNPSDILQAEQQKLK